MPIALGATAFTVGATAVTYGAVLQTTLIVGSAIHARRQAKKARQRALDAIQDQTIMVRTSTAVRPIVLGSARISGPIFPLGKSGPDGERLHFVLPLAGPSDGVGTVYVGDQAITSWDADGWVQEGHYARTWQEPDGETLTVNGSAQVTLAHEASAVLAIASPVVGDTDSGGFYLGNPATDLNAYALSVVGGKTRVQFHANRVGLALVVSYTWARSQSYLRIKFHDGQSGQSADSYLMQELPSRWTSDHVGHGVSYLAVTMIYHPDVFPTGIPNFSADLRGDRIRDPRYGTEVNTTNNALHARHLLKSAFNCADSEIDDTLIAAAANACGEAVQTDAGTTEPRYTFHGSLPTSMSPKDMLEAVLDAMMGYAVYSSGKWRVYAGVWRPPTLALGDEDFANETIVVQGRQGRRDMTNCARARYQLDTGLVTDAPAWVSPTYIAEDKGEEAFVDLDLQFTRGAHRAQRIEKRTVLQARQAMTVSGAYKMSAYEVTAGDVVELTLSTHGVVDKPFLVAQADRDPMGSGVRLAMREVAEAIDDWTFDEARNPDPAPNTTLPDHRVVPQAALTFGSGAQFAQVLADGSVRPYLRVYWQQVESAIETIEIGWRRAAETSWQWQTVPAERDAFDIFGVSGAETYIVIARFINAVGVHSRSWSAYRVDIDTSAPANGGNVTLGAGANLLPNATMANTANGWVAYIAADGRTVDIVDAPAPQVVNGVTYYAGRVFAAGALFGQWVRVHPYNAILLHAASGAAANFGALQNRYVDYRVPVKTGDRIEIQARAASSNAHTSIYVQTFDAGGNYVGALTPTGGDRTLLASDGKAGNLTLDSFKHLWGFVDIPPGVASVSWMMDCIKAAGGETSAYVAASMPYLGYARVGQAEPTEWSAGPSGGKVEGLDAVNTAQILPEAATQVLFASSAGGTLPSGPGALQVTICSIPISNTSDRDIGFLASAAGSARVHFGAADNPSYAVAGLFATGASIKVPLTAQSLRICETTAAGNRHETFSLVNRGVLAPGDSATINLVIWRNNKTNLGPTEYAQLDWHETTLRLELIKA